jgi:hypothetical protein
MGNVTYEIVGWMAVWIVVTYALFFFNIIWLPDATYSILVGGIMAFFSIITWHIKEFSKLPR